MSNKTIRNALMDASKIILEYNNIGVTEDKKKLLYNIMKDAYEEQLDDIRESDDEDIKQRLLAVKYNHIAKRDYDIV